LAKNLDFTDYSILALDQPARLPEVHAAFVSVNRIQARDLSFGGGLRGQYFNNRERRDEKNRPASGFLLVEFALDCSESGRKRQIAFQE